MLRRFAAAAVTLLALSLYSASDGPDVAGWAGTGYRGGWFTYAVKSGSEGFKLASSSQFVLSPQYSAPVRKVILKVQCNSATPSRTLCVKPFVGGIESDEAALLRELSAPGAKDADEYIHFNWDAANNVDAVRICLGGSGSSGEWTIGEIHIFYGDKQADEDEIVRELVKELPSPLGLHFTDIELDSLTVAADEVEYASGYLFEAYRLVGDPRTEVREDFSAAPEVSASWTMTTVNAKLDFYTSASYCDTAAAAESRSLKIEKSSSSGEVRVEILSPLLPVAARECSFMYKVGSKGKSDVFLVYGNSGNGEWRELGRVVPESTSKGYAKVELEKSEGIKQFKFVVTGDGSDFSTAAIDGLSIVYGGDEARVSVGASQAMATAQYSLSNLETGRYAVRVKALAAADSEYGDSLWSQEEIVDLKWAELIAEAPTDITCQSVDGKLRVSWRAAGNAGYYLVKVVTSGIPSETIIEAARTEATSIDLALPELGDYTVIVTAYSPGGKTSASAAPIAAALELGKLGKVTATAVDRETLKVSWSGVAHAEGYRVRVFELGGETALYTSDYSGLPEVWPEGWTHYEYLQNTYSGPVPKIDVRDCWISTCAYPMPITRADYSFKSHASAALTALTKIAVDISSAQSGDEWSENYAIHDLTTSKQNISLPIPFSMGVRRLRFRFLFDNNNPHDNPAVEFGAVTVLCGEETRREVVSLRTESASASIGSLPQDGRFVVEVTPLPSEGDALSSVSGEVDLSLMKPREVTPVMISDIAGAAYCENFDTLAAVSKETSLKEIEFPHWQLRKGDDEAETLKYSATGKATAGGVYAIVSGEDAKERALGSLSTSSFGCSFGIAFSNDLQTVVESAKLSFTAVQRSFKAAPKSYVLEYRVTQGDCGIDADGEWTGVEIPQTAPLTAETCAGISDLRQGVGPIELGVALPPGGVLVFRWRDAKGASSPMMGVDDVRFECTASPRSLTLILR